MRKFLRGLLVMGAAAAVYLGASSVDASAAAIPAKDVTIDYENQQLKLTESATAKDQEIYFGVATVKSVKDKATNTTSKVLSTTSWDLYDYKAGLTIDLSSLNPTKDNYIQIKGNKAYTDPLTIKIPAINSKVKAVFNALDASVTVNDVTNPKAPVAVPYALQYRTLYGTWTTYTSSTDLTIYQPKGATLYFRAAPYPSAKVSTLTTDANDVVDAAKAAITVYTSSTFAGKELKVAVGKLANAPKISVDYVKQQFTIAKNTEYRINTTSALGTWSGVQAAAVKVDAPATAGTLEVRTAATATKPASKAAQLSFAARDALTVKCTNTKTTTAAAKLAYDISANSIGTDVTVAYASKVVKGQTVYTGITLTNNTTDAYQVIVADANTYTATSLPAATVAGKAVGAATTKNGAVTPKATTIALNDGQQVFIRKVGVAKTATWSTDYVGLGTVKFPTE